MNHQGTKVIETDRLTLRPFKRSDAAAMYRNWASDPEVTRFLTWPVHASVDVSEAIILDWKKDYARPDNYQWCMEWKATGEAIGSIGAVKVSEEIQAVEIGYCTGKAFWNQGIMTEALKALVEFFFEEVEVNRISARHDLNNPNSGKVMAAAGLSLEGTHLEAARNNQGICDEVIYGLTKKIYSGR